MRSFSLFMGMVNKYISDSHSSNKSVLKQLRVGSEEARSPWVGFTRAAGARRERRQEALRPGHRALRRRLGGGGGAARRAARPERGGEVDAREDRVRARAREWRERRDLRRAGRLARRAARPRVPRGAVPVPVLDERRRAARAPPAADRLRRRRGRARRAARARRPPARARHARRRDVEGDAAAARDRAGARRLAAPAPPRRADERARPGRATRRARTPRGAPGTPPRGASP